MERRQLLGKPCVKVVLTSRDVKVILTVEIAGAARKHGIDDEDIRHAWAHAIRYVEYEYDDEERLLVIGADRHGRMLELVAVSRGRTEPDHSCGSSPLEVLRLPEMR